MINKIADDLNIRREGNESKESWKNRILYSLTGLQMLSSLYDCDDSSLADLDYQNGTISMQHVLKRGGKLVKVFDLTDDCAEKIRELYVSGGFMLHKNNRLAPPLLTISGIGNVALFRGLPPWKASNVSGLGIWGIEENTACIEDMFNIEKQNIPDWFDNFMNRVHWRKIQTLYADVEFLNITEPSKYGYWLQRPPSNGTTVCRTINAGERQYSLLKFGEDIKVCHLPNWFATHGEYRRIAIALRIYANNRPTVRITKHRYTANIAFDYMLPPSEQIFAELYSWSAEANPFDIRGRLLRIISIELLPIYKTIFIRLGFNLQEG